MQANNLACYNFKDTRGRHKTPRSRIKNFITHNNSSSQSISIFLHGFPSPISHMVIQSGPGDICTCSRLPLERNPELRECESLIVGGEHGHLCFGGKKYLYLPSCKHICPLVWKETLSKLVTIQYPWKDSLEQFVSLFVRCAKIWGTETCLSRF